MILSFQKLVKELLVTLPKNDYPVLNTRLFVKCWLGFTLDKSLTSILTSKLLWAQGYHQVKLFSSLNLSTGIPEENLINFGYDHDYKYGEEMIEPLPSNGVGVMDRGFAGLDYIKQVSQDKKYFVLRISNSWKLEFEPEIELTRVGTGQKSGVYRLMEPLADEEDPTQSQ